MSAIDVAVVPFDHQGGGDYPGSRGVRVEATRPGAPGVDFSLDYPGVWITDSGDVEIDERGGRYPADELLLWLERVAAEIRSRQE